MLHWLRARNVALLRDVSLDFGESLNVVTGETGAGKSVLLEALGLVLGGRGRAQLVGSAGARAVVEAGFSPERPAVREPDPLERLLAEMGAAPADGEIQADSEIVIRRELRLGARGGSLTNRTTINGAAAPVAALRSLGVLLAEIYSQGEHLALLQPGAARDAVDAAGGHRALVLETGTAWRRLREAEERRDRFEANLRRTGAERAAMERALDEIERAAPQPGEKETLLSERRALGEAERLLRLLETAYQALYGSEDAAASQLARACRALDEAAEADPQTARLLEGRGDLLAEVEDLAAAVRERREAIEAAPARLAWIEDRLAVLRGLERRHLGDAGEPDALIELADEIRKKLAELADRSETRRRAGTEAEAAAGAYETLADALTEARRRAAAALCRGVEAELAELGLPNARFSIRIAPLEGLAAGTVGEGAAPERGEAFAEGEARLRDDPRERRTRHFREHGRDRVEFLFSAGPELTPAPIGQVASGGESSRFFLALKAAGAGKAGGPTLLFDEADAGVSGRIADAVGRRLLRLAESRQVVCVTHLPQVAALGNTHLVVEKLESDGSIRVRCLDGTARIEEIARMLAGPAVTESARRHARELLTGAKASFAPVSGS